MFPHNLLHHPATFCCIYCVCTSSVLHYTYIKFRARYFHYVSTPMEIPSQDFISEFHCFFSKEFTQIFDEVTHSPQLSVIPGIGIATVSPGKWYGTSECNYIFSSYALFALSFYTQNVKIYSDSFHITFAQRGDLWKQTIRQLQMGYTILTQKTTLLKLYSETRYFVLSS